MLRVSRIVADPAEGGGNPASVKTANFYYTNPVSNAGNSDSIHRKQRRLARASAISLQL
jgi:hypothetical protein